MARAKPAVPLSIRVSPEIRAQLEALCEATGRTKSFLTAIAIEQYLATQAWQIESIQQAIDEADSDKAEFVKHQDVVSWLKSWGDADEEEPG